MSEKVWFEDFGFYVGRECVKCGRNRVCTVVAPNGEERLVCEKCFIDQKSGVYAGELRFALVPAGYRILAPGEMDRETLEAAAKVADDHIAAITDDMCRDDWWTSTVANGRSKRIAAAIRALGGGEG